MSNPAAPQSTLEEPDSLKWCQHTNIPETYSIVGCPQFLWAGQIDGQQTLLLPQNLTGVFFELTTRPAVGRAEFGINIGNFSGQIDYVGPWATVDGGMYLNRTSGGNTLRFSVAVCDATAAVLTWQAEGVYSPVEAIVKVAIDNATNDQRRMHGVPHASCNDHWTIQAMGP